TLHSAEKLRDRHSTHWSKLGKISLSWPAPTPAHYGFLVNPPSMSGSATSCSRPGSRETRSAARSRPAPSPRYIWKHLSARSGTSDTSRGETRCCPPRSPCCPAPAHPSLPPGTCRIDATPEIPHRP